MKLTLLLSILIILFVFPCAAQRNSRKSASIQKARKLVEIQFSDNTELSIKMGRLLVALRKDSTAKAYVIVYERRRAYDCLISADTVRRNAESMLERENIDPDRIVVVDGGFREDLMVELFIVPKGAAPPVPTPTFEPSKAVQCFCPGAIRATEFILGASDAPLKFYHTTPIYEHSPKVKPVYKWTVSDGKIISGQGTPSITVERSKAGYKPVTATLEIGGLPNECEFDPLSATTRENLLLLPIKAGEYGVGTLAFISDFDFSFTGFERVAEALESEPSVEAYLIVYGEKQSRRNEAQSMSNRMKDYLVRTLKAPADRIRIVDGGFRKEFTIEAWIVEKGKTPPISIQAADTRTVD